MSGKQIIKKGCSCIADVRNTCWTWGYANTYFLHNNNLESAIRYSPSEAPTGASLHCTPTLVYTQYMLSLGSVTGQTRSILKWGGILLGIFAAIWVVAAGGISIKERLFPTPAPPPTVGFGKLPQPGFPKETLPLSPQNQSQTNKIEIIYSLDTLTGLLPVFPDRIKVYSTVPLKPSLLALEKIQKKASDLGFDSKPTQISENIYQWITQDSIPIQLTFNIFSSDFSLFSSYLTNPEKGEYLNESDKENAVVIATSFIESLTSMPNDIDSSKTTVSLFDLSGTGPAPVTRIAQAKILKVNFFQKDIDGLPIYYPNDSIITMVLGKQENQIRVVMGEFYHQSISDKSSTYPIKTADEALEELRAGNAYIDQNPERLSNVNIRQISLGYFLSNQRLGYLLPIVEFVGDKDFKAYVPAVKDEWVYK